MRTKLQQKLLTSNVSEILIAVIVGLLTGVGAVLFRYLIKFVEWASYTWVPDTFPGIGKSYVVIIPAVGGLIVGLLIFYFAREAKGHGVPEVMEAVALKGGRIRPIVAVIKSLASSISIGSGGSVGREGPIVQIGSALGSFIGQRLKLSEDRIQILVACGAAAGIAATFNAPIAGVVFALEIIIGEFNVRHFSNVVISAVAASIIGRAVFGDVPAFMIPFEYGINSLWEFAFYPVLALLAAGWGVLYVRSLYWSEDFFEKWKRIPEWVLPAIGGVMLGIVALAYPYITGITWDTMPQIYNVGYGVIESALANEIVLVAAVSLMVLKLIATCITLGSGGSGGVFAPSLFMGALLGTAFDLLIRLIFPGISAPPGAYALVGMAATFSASTHAPITAVLILFELTGDYRIILPLMLTVVITTIVSQKMLKGESIYTLKLTRRGIRIKRGKDIDILESVLVSEVMSQDFTVISRDATLQQFSKLVNQTHSHGAVVLDDKEKLWGIITISDLERAFHQNLDYENTLVSEVATKREKMLTIFPDETIGQALYKMGLKGLGRLPVVSRQDPNRLMGLVRRYTIIRAYHLALTRRSEISHRVKQMTVSKQNELEIINLMVTREAAIAGMTVKKIFTLLPDNCLLVSVKKDGRTIIPHGDTEIDVDDSVSIIVNRNEMEKVVHLFQQQMIEETE